MASERKVANAIGGKTARACDSCLRKRARWFCAADDAFLCQACDSLVHSANPLASRHERVRLETSSYKGASTENSQCLPAWHQGVTRKARTPRNGKPTMAAQTSKLDDDKMANPILLVPEMGSEEASTEEMNDEQLLYQVPVFDPYDEFNALLNDDEGCDLNIPEFFTCDMELADFAADVESLLGTGLDDVNVKVEDEDEEVRDVIACHLDPALDDMAKETMSWDFDYGSSSMNVEDELDQKIHAPVQSVAIAMDDNGSEVDVKKMMLLRLDYEAVIAAWDNQSSPWTNGTRPEFNPNACWPDFLGIGMGENHQDSYGGHEQSRLGDVGREARVSRYREKRRTRLFSKKIRYEVRKLNAEKRPRMKGRFVKRTSIIGQGLPYILNK